MAPQNPFADSAFSSATDVNELTPSTPAKRMPSTALPPAAPYEAVAKPWTQKPNPRVRISYFLTYALVFVGAGLGALQSALTYRNDDFTRGDDAAVFGSGGKNGRWLREVQMDGFGNGQWEWAVRDDDRNGNLYLVPTLTPGWPFADGTTYNSTACTFNLTAPNGGFLSSGAFDWHGYFTACSRTTNATAGTIINPVQSARLSTLVSAHGDESTHSRGSLRYGKVEVRAKMPVGDWLWPAIWMLPVDSAYGPWPRSGEIDIVESRGNGIRYTNRGANYVQGALNWGPTRALNGVGHSYSCRIYVDTRLHTLLDLKFNEPFFKRGEFPQTLTGTDEHPVALQNPWQNGTNATPFDQDFYLILNVAVGGTNGWFPDGQGDKPWLNAAGNPPMDFIRGMKQWLPTWPENVEERAMVVDYVKMWKHCGDP
ncbi:glycoside hydrolase family 16 protein [Mycena vulgaris]|nr:glycoside hydrolase family 16 protein [Mycena vulgaris]